MKNKTKILHVTLYLEIGGLETLVMEMCKFIDRERYDVNVLCLCGYDPSYKDELEKIDIPVFLIKKKGWTVSFFIKIIQLIKCEDVDIIHIHSGCFFNASICGFFSGIKRIVYTAHGMPVNKGLQATMEDKLSSMIVNKLIAVSEEIKQNLIKLHPSQKNKISLIQNGVNTKKFRPLSDKEQLKKIKVKYRIPSDKVIIGSVGRLEGVKNYKMLISAFARVQKNYQGNVHLVLIGDGSERERLEKLVKELGVEDCISFLGIQYNLNVIIPVLDIFVLSSLSEGTSISLLEAQSCGIPAIVTDVGGNGKIIRNGFNGFLCKVNDYEEMANKIHELIKNEDLLSNMGKNACSVFLENYDLTSMVKSYEKLYEELIFC